MSEREKCLQYVRSFPWLEADDTGPNIKYRCNLCASRKHPKGKWNSLGNGKDKLNDVMFFLARKHFASARHIQEQMKYDAAAEDQAQASETRDCPGFWVTDPDGVSPLHWQQDEFKLWVRHANLKTNHVQHCYRGDISGDKWFIKHRDCEDVFVPDQQNGVARKCCQRCETIGSSQGVIRSVNKFTSKFYAAQLLQKRLFGQEARAKQWLDEMEKGSFAKRRSHRWQKVKELSNCELQKFVRKSFSHMEAGEQTQVLQLFVESTVNPCLRVHPNSVSSNVVALSHQLVAAMNDSRLDAPCLEIVVGYRGML